jgi:hypothetical protein
MHAETGTPGSLPQLTQNGGELGFSASMAPSWDRAPVCTLNAASAQAVSLIWKFRG